jgi:hypothetical protein
MRLPLIVTALVLATAPAAAAFEPRSLDGSGNNVAHPEWGRAGVPYVRVAPARYGDGIASQARGPSPRYVSNRVFNDVNQNVFSERGVSQWVWTWGQFVDHNIGLAQDGPERAPIPFDSSDALERFRNDLGVTAFRRDAAAPGTGTAPGNPRQHVNTASSYIDGWAVYGGTRERLEWLRTGRVDGDLRNNGASLLLTADGYLPRGRARGVATAPPTMALDGRLTGRPLDAVVAGDVRANENMALTAVHTLFAREHNRIVGELPARLTAEERFQIARRIVGAEIQFITYREFLPAAGVKLGPYRGYDPSVDPSLGNEFATVAYRAHSMIHGEFEVELPGGREITVALGDAFFNPDLVQLVGLGPALAGLSNEAQYKNDEQIDDALRSVLFQIPGAAVQGVVDLGALDVQRGRDHGMPTYNQLRAALGLKPKRSFRAITGERTQRFPADRRVDPRRPIDDPDILDFVKLLDADGERLALGSDEAVEGARTAVRRTTLAARLAAIYPSVRKLDAFVGMLAEPHVRGSELGELQLALWRRQFEALRAGDRFFYRHDPALPAIRRAFGIDYRRTLSELIRLNTNAEDVPANVFFAPAGEVDDEE